MQLGIACSLVQFGHTLSLELANRRICLGICTETVNHHNECAWAAPVTQNMRILSNWFCLGVSVWLRAFGCPQCFVITAAEPPAEEQSDPLPALSIIRQDGKGVINFSGGLQFAETVLGPWMDVPNAANPYALDSRSQNQFFRTRAAGGILSADSVVEFTLTGPFQQHFDLAFAGLPDGIFPPVREKPYFDGILRMAGLELPVRIRVRGNSSLQECPFPKLKMKISTNDRKGTPFSDAREIKIGTHCAEGGRGTIGRLRDQSAAFREVLAYEVMRLLGFVSPRIRRARVEYQDSSPAAFANGTGWNIIRMSFLFDHVELVAERLKGRDLEDEEVAALVDAGFDEQLVTDLKLFHALIGNWDYSLSPNGQGLWNMEVIELENGTLVPIAGDFDLSSWVTGEVRVTAPRDYFPELDDLERQALFEIQQIQTFAGLARFEAGSNRFLSRQADIESLIRASIIDEAGKDNALQHFSVFFQVLVAAKEEDEPEPR